MWAIVVAEGQTKSPDDDIIIGYGAAKEADSAYGCHLGRKYWGERNGPQDLWENYNDEDFYVWQSRLTEKKLFSRYHNWNPSASQRCFGKPFQCSSFIGYLLTGKMDEDVSTTSLCSHEFISYY